MPARPIRSASAEATLPFLTKGQVSREDGPQGPPSKHLQELALCFRKVAGQRQIQLESLILAQNER